MDLLEAGGIHLLPNDPLDVAVHDPPQRQPRETTGCDAADVAGADEQPVAGHLRIDGIVAKGSQEEGRHTQHGPRL